MVDGAGTLRGVLTREALIAALQHDGGATPVIEIMDRDVPTVPENACLDNVFQRLQRRGHAFRRRRRSRQRLVGYITAENLAELVMIRWRAAPHPGRPPPRRLIAGSRLAKVQPHAVAAAS